MTDSSTPAADADFEDLAAQWRALVLARTGRLELPSLSTPGAAPVSAADALARARQMLTPPVTPPLAGLTPTLARALSGWDEVWTRETQTSATWSQSGRRLSDCLQLLKDRRLSEAEQELAALLGECSPRAQAALRAVPATLRGLPPTGPPPEQRRLALLKLIHWLEGLG